MTGECRKLVEKCRRNWHEAGLSRHAVESMAGELESHLLEASADGRDAWPVIGDSLPALRLTGQRSSTPQDAGYRAGEWWIGNSP